MNKYTINGYNKGWIKGCPKCGTAGELTVDKTFTIPSSNGDIETIYGRKCMSCGYECAEPIWDMKGKSWNGSFGGAEE